MARAIFAYDIFVSGGDVYIAGYESKTVSSTTYSIGWVRKNNALLYNLTARRVLGIYVSNNDIYVCGSTNVSGVSGKDLATVWKNENTLLSYSNIVSGTSYACAYDIKVLGSTVYVALKQGPNSSASIYKYESSSWTVPFSYSCPPGTVSPYIYPYALDVEANAPNDVYWFIGHSNTHRVFKGNTEIYTFSNDRIADLAVKNGDAYLAGYSLTGYTGTIKVWKNGEELFVLTDGTYDARAEAIFVVAQ